MDLAGVRESGPLPVSLARILPGFRRNGAVDCDWFFPTGGVYSPGKEGQPVQVYLDLVILLNFAVNYALLQGVAVLTAAAVRTWRLGAAAALGAAYAGLCVALPFLAGNLWRLVCLAGMVTAAFGLNRGSLRRGAVLLALSFALGGVALCLQLRNFWALILAAGLAALACRLFLRGGMRHAGQLTRASIALGGRQVELTALRDSGNSLTDPFSGAPVLVAQYDAVKKLLPCPLPQPADPAAAMTRLQAQGVGCRLIPYHALGGSGMLLAVRCDRVTVGGKAAGPLVAIAPGRLGSTYQALTGGGQYA